MAELENFIRRLRAALPLRWFPDDAPTLTGVLAGVASAWAIIWQNLQFVKQQTRILTASGAWLDAVANDFFGASVIRSAGLTDSQFRFIILSELFKPRGTRQAVVETMVQLTGSTPAVFEPTNIRDFGACGSAATVFYAVPGIGAGPAQSVAAGGQGGYGNATMILQALVAGNGQGGPALVPVASVQSALARTMPCGGIAWLGTTE